MPLISARLLDLQTVEEEIATIDDKKTGFFFILQLEHQRVLWDHSHHSCKKRNKNLPSQLQEEKQKSPGEDLGEDSPLFSC